MLMEFNETYIYRILHIDNLPHILRSGLISGVNHVSADKDYVGIGEKDLIDKRKNEEVAIFNSRVKICPCCEYIPFYFAPRSVMLLRIQTGNNLPKVDPDKIVYFIFKLSEIIEEIDYLFTDGHGYAKISRWFDDLDYLNELSKDDLERKHWRNTEADPDRQRRKQAEFWVKDKLNIRKAMGIGVYDAPTKKIVDVMIEQSNIGLSVKIKRDWYYD